VKDLEARGHMRVERSRNGSKNNPNHYHPNIWRTAGGDIVSLGGDHVLPRVGTQGTPEPMNEPTREPTIRNISREDKIGGRGSGDISKPIGQPQYRLDGIGPRRLVQTSEVMEILGIVPRVGRASRWPRGWVTDGNPCGE
jgi:hypothetical protein